MLKSVRLLAECYDKHFAFLIYAQLKAIIDRLHTSVRNDFKVKKLMNQKICMPVEDCFISIIELKPVEDKILNKYGRKRRLLLQQHNPILYDDLTLRIAERT